MDQCKLLILKHAFTNPAKKSSVVLSIINPLLTDRSKITPLFRSLVHNPCKKKSNQLSTDEAVSLISEKEMAVI